MSKVITKIKFHTAHGMVGVNVAVHEGSAEYETCYKLPDYLSSKYMFEMPSLSGWWAIDMTNVYAVELVEESV